MCAKFYEMPHHQDRDENESCHAMATTGSIRFHVKQNSCLENITACYVPI